MVRSSRRTYSIRKKSRRIESLEPPLSQIVVAYEQARLRQDGANACIDMERAKESQIARQRLTAADSVDERTTMSNPQTYQVDEVQNRFVESTE